MAKRKGSAQAKRKVAVRQPKGLQLAIVPIDSLKPHPRNLKYHPHPDSQIESLAESARQFSQYKNIVTWRGLIIAGNGFWEGAKRAGLKEIAVKDVSDWPESKALALLAADNEIGKVAPTDDAELASIVQELYAQEGEALARLAAGEQAALDRILSEAKRAAGEKVDPATLIDKAAELQKRWKVKRGDVWSIGRHRLMCGDSTSKEDVDRLMEGKRAQFTFTDPPYNVGVAYGDATDDNRSKTDFVAWCKLWAAFLPDRVLMTVGIKRLLWWDEILGDPQWIIAWVKKNGQGNTKLGGTNKWDAILCYGVDRDNNTDLIELNNDYSESIKADNGHPTAKPVALWTQVLERFSKGSAIVFEPFLGTGTTLIACEQTGRIGRGMEIEPKYVSVSLERLTNLGLEPRRVEAA